MADEQKRPNKLTSKSKDYRIFATDTFGLRVSNHMVQLVFSLETVDENGDACIVTEGTAVLTLLSAKILSFVLSQSIADLEAALGPIPLPPGKLEELTKALREAEPKAKA